jgi:hypothetical protein
MPQRVTYRPNRDRDTRDAPLGHPLLVATYPHRSHVSHNTPCFHHSLRVEFKNILFCPGRVDIFHPFDLKTTLTK